jgi:hypothetical protein
MSVSVDFSAPRERVWRLFVDPEFWSQWNTEWNAIRDVQGPFDHPGSGYTQVLRVFGREFLGRWEVIACEPQAWRTIAGTLPFGAPFRGCDRFEEANGVTRVTVEIEWVTPWGWIGRVIEFVALPVMRRQFASNARRAAALLEE